MAYIISDHTIYGFEEEVKNRVADPSPTGSGMIFDFSIKPYDLKTSTSYRSDNGDRLMGSLERALSMVTRLRSGRNERHPPIVPVNATDTVSNRTRLRRIFRQKRAQYLMEHQRGNCCSDICRWIFMVLSLALFPAVVLVLLMNQVLFLFEVENPESFGGF